MSAKETSRLSREAKEKGELLDAILDGLSEGVLATDLEGCVLFANPVAREMLGMTKERIQNFQEPQELPEPFEDFDLAKAVDRCAEAGECPEAAVVTKKESSSLRIRLTRLEEFDDHRGGVLIMVRDLSERLRLEAAQQRFLAVAAHEVKAPLTVILGAAELLRSGSAEEPETRDLFLGHIEDEARRACDLSNTLLSMARVGHDQREARLEQVHLLEAVQRAAERVGLLARSMGVELRVKGEGDHAQADREWLDQVLLAVLDNAMKYSDHGGGVTLRAEGTTIAVEDEGFGISEADLPSVFEPYHRGGDTRGARGTGLGLPVARELVERMGGTISIESKEGTGSTVRIELARGRSGVYRPTSIPEA